MSQLRKPVLDKINREDFVPSGEVRRPGIGEYTIFLTPEGNDTEFVFLVEHEWQLPSGADPVDRDWARTIMVRGVRLTIKKRKATKSPSWVMVNSETKESIGPANNGPCTFHFEKASGEYDPPVYTFSADEISTELESTGTLDAEGNLRFEAKPFSPTTFPIEGLDPLESGLPGFGDLDKVILILLAAQEHAIVVGTPGLAKSLWTRRIFNQLEGQSFDKELSKWSDESSLFGMPDIRKMREEGKIVYHREGIAVCDWASIQEFFDASDVLLRTLLGILQERVHLLGNEPIAVPLRSCLATANYTRVNEITMAVTDRFAFTLAVPALTPEQRTLLYNNTDYESMPSGGRRIHKDVLDDVKRRAADVEIPAGIVHGLLDWAQKHQFTPRRERKAANVLRTAAALRGDNVVGEDDLNVMTVLLPLTVQQSVDLSELKGSIKDALREITQLRELDRFSLFPSSLDSITKLKETSKRLKGLMAFASTTDQVELKRKKIQDHLKEVYRTLTKELEVDV